MRRIGRRLIGVLIAATAVLLAACTSGSATHDGASATGTTSPGTPSSSPTRTTAAPTTPATTPTTRPAATKQVSAKTARVTTAPAAKPRPSTLPLAFGTGAATQVITVVAGSTSSTQARLQAWRKVAGGWARVGAAVHAWLGTGGLTKHPSETRTATPIGSFTLTRAFGHDADPGTSLPYTHTGPSDWWISQPGPLYNTMQDCSSGCAFTRGDPNEHLYYETPYYNYALVIDYNTRNAPGGVRQGAGSAFFLHVTVGEPTQGCISIAESQVVRLLKWLEPSRHPRILIGTG